MHRRSVLLVAPGVAVGVMLLLASLALAATFTLSGRVGDQTGTGIVGTTVEALQPGTTTVVTSTTTGANGAYSLSLDAGTYDIRVTPPSGTGFQPTSALGQQIMTDRTLDFILVPGAAVTVSGRVTDAAGAGVPNQFVLLSPAAGGPNANTTTDASGAYTLSVAPGSYDLFMNVGRNRASAATLLPSEVNLNSRSSLSVTGNLALDLPLPPRNLSIGLRHLAREITDAPPRTQLARRWPASAD